MKIKSFLIGVLGGIIISITMCCLIYIPYVKMQVSSNFFILVIAFCCVVSACVLLYRNHSVIHAIIRGTVMILSSIIIEYIFALAGIFVYFNDILNIHDNDSNDMAAAVIMALTIQSVIVVIIIITLLLLVYNILMKHYITDNNLLIGRKLYEYAASKLQIVLKIAELLFVIGLFLVVISFKDFFLIDKIIILPISVMCGIGVVVIGYELLNDPVLGKVSFDNEVVYFHTPLRTISFYYDECAEIGFTKWTGPGGTAYYIYLSKVKITDEQRDYLFRGRFKRNREKRNMPLYHSEYLMFQYTNEVFDAFINTVPSKFRDELIRKKIEMGISVYD